MSRLEPDRSWTVRPRLKEALAAVTLATAVGAVLALSLEAGSFLVLRRRVSLRTWTSHPGETMRAYREPWGKTLWAEQRRALEFRYHPFLQRRSSPFVGETINVDAQGRRRTVSPRCEPGAPVIWMFGGSTMWGLGNPDWSTIPSEAAAELARRGRAACVVNYGEDAWTTTQGVVKLVLELKAADRPPDAVVFLNGCNDLFTPFRLTGDPALEYDYVEYREALDELLTARRGTWGWLRLTNAATLWRVLRQRRGAATAVAPGDRDALARRISRDYFANLRVLEGLAAAHGFRRFAYWQPMPLYGNKPLADEERSAMDGLASPTYRDGLDAASRVIPLIQAARVPGFRYLGDLFDGRRESLYLDACHLQPAGNQLVAKTIVDDLVSDP